MTVRKPPGVSWQSWIDKQIEQGWRQGDFDNLPGHGQPIEGLGRPRDELWWVRDKLKREGVEYLPPALAIRKKATEVRAKAIDARSDHEARTMLEDLNAEIRHLNSHTIEGPPTTLMPLDVDEVMGERAEAVAARVAATPVVVEPDDEASGDGGRVESKNLFLRWFDRARPGR